MAVALQPPPNERGILRIIIPRKCSRRNNQAYALLFSSINKYHNGDRARNLRAAEQPLTDARTFFDEIRGAEAIQRSGYPPVNLILRYD